MLNALYHQAFNNDSTCVAKESYPYRMKYGLQSWDTLRLSQIESIQAYSLYDGPDSLTFTDEDVNTFNRQLDTNPQVSWPQWGWKTPNFIAEEKYPDYFSKGAVLPPSEPPSTPHIKIVSISVPLVSSDRAFVTIEVNKGYRSVASYVYLLGKRGGSGSL